MPHFAPEACLELLQEQAPLKLAFDPRRDYASWRAEVKRTLRELLGKTPALVPLDVRVEGEFDHETLTETRFVFTAEANADVPCHLLVPKNAKRPTPVMICLQGHSTGMHISLGRPQFEGDAASIAGGRGIALQAVAQGYAALALELRCFGERRDARPPERHGNDNRCHHASMNSLLLGRTMIGERVWDVMRAIDALGHFSGLDLSRIGCMGNSGGGTITYFSACMDERISAAMPSCYVCTFRDSIGKIDHCACNYVPRVLEFFEMGDLACLIAPRPLVVVAGAQDRIFPIAAVRETFARIQEIYRAAGAPERCRLVVGSEGHQFYPEQAWPVFRELSGWRQP
jgi:cephalosporin-C deacetylase-like acetyl esterase